MGPLAPLLGVLGAGLGSAAGTAAGTAGASALAPSIAATIPSLVGTPIGAGVIPAFKGAGLVASALPGLGKLGGGAVGGQLAGLLTPGQQQQQQLPLPSSPLPPPSPALAQQTGLPGTVVSSGSPGIIGGQGQGQAQLTEEQILKRLLGLA